MESTVGERGPAFDLTFKGHRVINTIADIEDRKTVWDGQSREKRAEKRWKNAVKPACPGQTRSVGQLFLQALFRRVSGRPGSDSSHPSLIRREGNRRGRHKTWVTREFTGEALFAKESPR